MKTIYIAFTLISASVLLLVQAINQQGFSDNTGAPAGRAGSPFDSGGLTCNTSGCHTGLPLGTRSGWITSNIPVSGYTPGQTYTITATATSPTRIRFGFEITPQTTTGVTAGTSIITNTQQTKLAASPNTRWVTHTLTGTLASVAGSKTWNFDWTAPAAGTGTVTFYGAFNCSNNSGTSLGDSIFTSQMVVQENTSTGIVSAENESSSLLLYPNPASTYVNIAFSAQGTEEFTLNIYDSMGKRIWMAPVTQPDGKHNMTLNLENAGIHKKGIYFIEVTGAERSFSGRFMVL